MVREVSVDPVLLDILVCPACKAKVRQQGEALVCTQAVCGLEYPVRDGIPVMLIDEARKRA